MNSGRRRAASAYWQRRKARKAKNSTSNRSLGIRSIRICCAERRSRDRTRFGDGYHVHPHGGWLCLSGRGARLVVSQGGVMDWRSMAASVMAWSGNTLPHSPNG